MKYSEPLSEAAKDLIRQLFPIKVVERTYMGQLEGWEIVGDLNLPIPLPLPGIEELQLIAQGVPGIQFIEPDYISNTGSIPNDPHFSKQWALQNSGQTGGRTGADIKILEVWAQDQSASQRVAGVIDTGIDWGHEDLIENIWQNLAEDADGDGRTLELINGVWQLDPGDLNQIDDDGNGYPDDLIGWDFVNDDNNPFDDNGHGTHVAGIIAAERNNGKGIAGVSRATKLMALKAFDAKGSGSVLSIAPAFEYARRMGIHLSNNSWGGPAFSQAIHEEVQFAESAGILAICAAGNYGSSNNQEPVYPGSFDLSNVICVGASTHDDQLATFSNFSHDRVDMMAPGQDIYSTLPDNQYGYKSGTSMSTPLVSGAISLLWAMDTSLQASQLKAILMQATDVLSTLTDKCATGGRLNGRKLMRSLRSFCDTLTEATLGMEIPALLSVGKYIWLGSTEGLMQLHTQDCQQQIYTTLEGLSHNRILALDQSENGEIWAATQEGLNVFDGSQWRSYLPRNSGLPDKNLRTVFVDAQDRVWVGTQQQGLVRYEAGQWSVFDTYNSGIPHNQINDIAADVAGNIWVATQGGVAKYDNQTWTVYENLLSEYVSTSLVPDAEGNLWVGTLRHGVLKFDGNQVAAYHPVNSDVPSNQVNALAVDQQGDLWVATTAGLARYNGQSWIVYKEAGGPGALPSLNVLTVEVDPDNHVWVGTDAGIFLFAEGALHSSFSLAHTPCQAAPVDFYNTSSGASQYEWWVDGALMDTTTHFRYIFPLLRPYEVSLVAKNMYTTDTLVQQFQVQPMPALTLCKDTTACASAVVLEVGDITGRYSWVDFAGDTLSRENILRVTRSGQYQLSIETVCGTTLRDTVGVYLSGDCVWPGDVSADGMVNMVDFLTLSTLAGASGPARSDTLTQWQALSAPNWPSAFSASHPLAPKVNYKHADCNGDGQIDLSEDAAVILRNVSFTHQPTSQVGARPLSLRVEPLVPEVIAEDTFIIYYDIHLEGNHQEHVHGMAFSLDYNLPLSQQPTLTFADSIGDEWSYAIISHDTRNESRSKQLRNPRQRMDIGIVRNRQSVRRMRSKVAQLGVIVVLEDIQDGVNSLSFTSFSLTSGNLVVVDEGARTQPTQDNSSSATSSVAIQSSDSAFPVEWLDFKGVAKRNQVNLQWQTARESGAAYYLVQRSGDGQAFENIGSLPGASQSSSPRSYSFSDMFPLKGNNHYRILREEIDGQQAYSAVITVNVDPNPFSFTVFPNPSSGPMDVRIIATHDGYAGLRLMNALGKVFRKETVSFSSGTQLLSLNTEALSPGIYYLELATESYRHVVKFKLLP